ncbi:MAG: hypothetical protein GY752_09465 [bacterium]|nr:hypothetical protein [bacterium]MCP4799189.1 hypothetical protein [bacterium]
MESTIYTEINPKPETDIFSQLITMYQREEQIYINIRDCSLEQENVLESGGEIAQIQSLLVRKRQLLDEIAQLEISNSSVRLLWERRKTTFTDAEAVQVRKSMKRVSSLLEEILNLEASNDQLLLQKSVQLAV